MTVYTEEMAKEVSDLACEMGKKAYIHVKLDTGMSRIGFPIEEASVRAIAEISKLPGLIPEGMFTHFPKRMRPINVLQMSSLKNICG